MKWEWKGERLAHPLTITRRLIAYPFFRLSMLLLVFFAWAGWGTYKARQMWRDLP